MLFFLEITNYNIIEEINYEHSATYRIIISGSCVGLALFLSGLCMKLQTEINEKVINQLETEKKSLNVLFTSGLQTFIFAKQSGIVINTNNKHIKTI